MPDDKTKRRRTIDDAIAAADGSLQERDMQPAPAEEKNPYPPGSARAKLWARKQAEKRKKEGQK